MKHLFTWMLCWVMHVCVWGQVQSDLGGLIAVTTKVDSVGGLLPVAEEGAMAGLNRAGIAIAAMAKQPYGLGLLRNQRLWVCVMRGRQAGTVRLGQGGRYPLQSIQLSLDYARVLSPQLQLGIGHQLRSNRSAGGKQVRLESALQVQWQPLSFFWTEWQVQRAWQQATEGMRWGLSTTLGFAWPARAACAIRLASATNQSMQIAWRGQAYVHPRLGLYGSFDPAGEGLGLGWWVTLDAWQFLMIGHYHAVLGISPQLSIQYQIKNAER